MNCPKCGSINNDGVKFCTSCGAEVSAPPAPQPITPDAGAYNQNPGQTYNAAPAPMAPPPGAPKGSTYLIWSILSTLFCCLPLGVAAIIYAAKIDSAVANGDILAAQEAAKKAKMFTIIGAIGGGIIMIAYFALVFIGGYASVMEGMLY